MSLHPALAPLPNAPHIARILVSVKADPGKWCAALDAAWVAALDAALGAARDAARDAALGAARDALAALIAWDHAGEYLSWDYDKLHAHWLITEEPAALLLLPAVLVLGSDAKEGV